MKDLSDKDIQKFLFDKVYENSMSLKKLKMTEKFFGKEAFGTLEVIARDDSKIGNDGLGKIIHHDFGTNKILVWAKHCITKLTAGEIFSKYGANREDPTENGNINSGVGTMISGRQYLETDYGTGLGASKYYMPHENTELKYPYFPTKMLFATGAVGSSLELNYPATNEANPNPKNEITNQTETIVLTDEGWVQSIHPSGPISGVDNYGIGAGKVWDSFSKQTYTNNIGSNSWIPSFIYLNRKRPFDVNTNTKIDKYIESNPEYNKLTFTVEMPSQLDEKWYPYNIESTGAGVQLKYAGLFCDSAFTVYTSNVENKLSGESPGQEFLTGIMWAKRAIQPITKSPSISINFYWTIYIPRE